MFRFECWSVWRIWLSPTPTMTENMQQNRPLTSALGSDANSPPNLPVLCVCVGQGRQSRVQAGERPRRAWWVAGRPADTHKHAAATTHQTCPSQWQSRRRIERRGASRPA
jgi:hypothetical protein